MGHTPIGGGDTIELPTNYYPDNSRRGRHHASPFGQPASLRSVLRSLSYLHALVALVLHVPLRAFDRLERSTGGGERAFDSEDRSLCPGAVAALPSRQQ